MASNTRETWLDAAFVRFNNSGLASVRVESIARDILATKGSFYWHFENRSELIDGVMERWEQHDTDQIIEITEQQSGAEAQLATLFDVVGNQMSERGGERTLYSEAEAEGVLEVVARVTERRIEYVADLLRQLGVSDATERATLAVAAAIGLQQLVTGGWEPPGGRELTETLLRMAVGR